MGPTLHRAGAGPQRMLVELKHLEWTNHIFQIKLHLDLLSCLISLARIIYFSVQNRLLQLGQHKQAVVHSSHQEFFVLNYEANEKLKCSLC